MTTLKLLVVDDEPAMRTVIARALRGFTVQVAGTDETIDFAVAEAATGEQALELLPDVRPDILLLDLKLPGLSGIEVLERIVAAPHELLTIMITAYATIETAVVATKRGAYDFLAKPFTPDELKGMLRKASQHLLLARDAARLAAEKRQVRFQFLSVLAHELKSPINAVEGYVNVLRSPAAPTDRAALENVLERCVVRLSGMRKLIDDLLDLTRIESGQKQRELAPVDVVEVARAAVEGVLPLAAARGIAVELHAPAPVPLLADRGELEIVLNNLLSNAVKYNRDGGRVDLAVAAAGDQVSIACADTGIGLSAEERGRLFGEFVRIRNERTRGIPGSGLGLSIVKKIAALYGGDVTVESEPGAGSTFRVTLRPGPIDHEKH